MNISALEEIKIIILTYRYVQGYGIYHRSAPLWWLDAL
jgi:hypothetical protein